MNYEQIFSNIDDTFFIIGLVIFSVEIIKSIVGGKLGGGRGLDMLASISTQIPYLLVEIFIMGFVYYGFVVLSESFVSWSFEPGMGLAIISLLLADFTYYWEHRIAHEVRLFWTQHAVHHSSRFMNVAVSVRFGPFETFLSALLHVPLVFIGIPAEYVFFSILIVLAYQSWIHTELIGKLGWLDKIFNTPANHRVHHGCDEKYIDKNYGGILIIWDRLFHTYQQEEETPNYGLKRDFNSINPIKVWFSELPKFARDLFHSSSLAEVMGRIFYPPDWQPEQASQLKS